MEDSRKIDVFNELLGWASEIWRGYELYEWAKNRGMTDDEIANEFCIEDEEMKEYIKEYDENYY